jgi:hypothetical protein
LREAFGLEKGAEVALGSAEVTVVRFAAHEFEAGEEGAELWLGEEHFLGTGTGGFVEHIDDVEEEEGALGGGGP